MDNFSSGYFPEDYNQGRIEEGDYKVKITDVNQKTSQSSGNPMLEIELSIAEATFKFKHYLVKNEYFNENATKFFDCFKIPRGNFDYPRWVGKIGKAHIGKGKPNQEGKQFMEVRYLIVDNPANQTPSHPRAPSPAVTPPHDSYDSEARDSPEDF